MAPHSLVGERAVDLQLETSPRRGKLRQSCPTLGGGERRWREQKETMTREGTGGQGSLPPYPSHTSLDSHPRNWCGIPMAQQARTRLWGHQSIKQMQSL